MHPNSAYKISAPAIHAARTLFRNFTVQGRSDIEPTVSNVATIIDLGTQMFRVAPAVRAVRAAGLRLAAASPTPAALKEGLERLREAVLALETTAQRLPRYTDGQATTPEVYEVSAPALHTAQMLCRQFIFSQTQMIKPTERNIAIVVDVCAQIGRVADAIQAVSRLKVWCTRDNPMEHYAELRRAVRAVDIVVNRLPDVGAAPTVTLREKQEIEIKLTRAQIKESQEVGKRLMAARTVQEQQGILARAGIVRA